MMGTLVKQGQGENGHLLLHDTKCENVEGCSLVYMDPMMPGQGR